MRDIGGLVWIVFVLFAVISSIVRSARKARSVPPPTSAVAPSRGAPLQRAQQRTTLIAQFAQDAQARAAPPPTPKPPPPPPPPRPVATARPAPIAPHVEEPVSRVRGFFADRNALVRGIIAAEVLGKPLALRDE